MEPASQVPGYHEGQTLKLTFTPEGGAPREIEAMICDLKEPFTCSVGMVVATIIDSAPTLAFLKLLDRRFVTGMRESLGIGEYTHELDYRYTLFVQRRGADVFTWYLNPANAIPGFDDLEYTPEEDEAFLAHNLNGLWRTEVAAYKAMQGSQGKTIPRLYGTCKLDITPRGLPSNEHFHINGILLQYLDAFPLDELFTFAAPSTWQKIVDGAVAVTREVDAANLCNMDTRPGNFLAVKDGKGGYKPFMIDLAMCVPRKPAETDAEWGRIKWAQNEDGAIGEAMKELLSEQGVDIIFERSTKYQQYAEGQDDHNNLIE